MALREHLEQQASRWEPDVLLRQMGYAQPRQAHRDRLAKVLADPELGLMASEYDFVYSSRDFLRALGKSLGMAQTCETLIAERDAFESAKHEAYKPWLSVEAVEEPARVGGFFRAMAVGKRHLPLPKNAWQLPWKEQIRLAKKLVRAHMDETGGKLPILGQIEGYRFHYAADRWIFLGRNGGIKNSGFGVVSRGANKRG